MLDGLLSQGLQKNNHNVIEYIALPTLNRVDQVCNETLVYVPLFLMTALKQSFHV